MLLSQSELERYSRHLLLPEMGIEGQKRLKSAAVLVVGAGGLGSPLILYLAAAGVGKIGILDFDNVDKSNLQRQIIYRDADVGFSKVQRAAQHASQLNPEIQIEKHELRLTAENALDIISKYDLVIDGSDNFSTRYLVNDACVLSKKANVHGAIYRFEGQASVFCYNDGPCYRCLFSTPPESGTIANCAEAGVLGVMAGLIACVQATEVLKIILGIGDTLRGTLLLYDALAMNFDKLPIPKDPNCAICGKNPSIRELKDIELVCIPESKEMEERAIAPTQLNQELKAGRQLVLLDVRTPEEVLFGQLPGARHIPLAELNERTDELNDKDDIVVYCKGGARSNKAMHILLSKGFGKTRNLVGGITAWAKEVDPTITVP